MNIVTHPPLKGSLASFLPRAQSNAEETNALAIIEPEVRIMRVSNDVDMLSIRFRRKMLAQFDMAEKYPEFWRPTKVNVNVFACFNARRIVSLNVFCDLSGSSSVIVRFYSCRLSFISYFKDQKINLHKHPTEIVRHVKHTID